jgi:hypothetical protein
MGNTIIYAGEEFRVLESANDLNGLEGVPNGGEISGLHGRVSKCGHLLRYQVYLGGTCSRLPAAASQVRLVCWTAGRASQSMPVNAGSRLSSGPGG